MRKKYDVEVVTTQRHTHAVLAETPQEAIELATKENSGYPRFNEESDSKVTAREYRESSACLATGVKDFE